MFIKETNIYFVAFSFIIAITSKSFLEEQKNYFSFSIFVFFITQCLVTVHFVLFVH